MEKGSPSRNTLSSKSAVLVGKPVTQKTLLNVSKFFRNSMLIFYSSSHCFQLSVSSSWSSSEFFLLLTYFQALYFLRKRTCQNKQKPISCCATPKNLSNSGNERLSTKTILVHTCSMVAGHLQPKTSQSLCDTVKSSMESENSVS